MKILSKKEQRKIVDKIVANAILTQEAIIKADLQVSQFTHYTDNLIANTTDIVFCHQWKRRHRKTKNTYKMNAIDAS